MAFTLNKKNGKPLTKDDSISFDDPMINGEDYDGKDNQLNKEEAASVGIDNNTFEQLDVDNTGKLSDVELSTIPQTFKDQSVGETQLPNTINDTEKGMYAGSTVGQDMGGLLNQGPLPQTETPFLGVEDKDVVEEDIEDDDEYKGNISLDVKPLTYKSSPTNLQTQIKELLYPSSTKSPISFDDAKGVLQSLRSYNNGTSNTHISGAGNTSFNMASSNPSYDTGHTLDTPTTGHATQTGPASLQSNTNRDVSPTTKMLQDILYSSHTGKSDFRHKGMPNIHSAESKVPEKTNPKKLGLTAAKENIFERIVDTIKRTYKSWPVKDGERVFERGLVALYVKGVDEIKIKFGSFRETLLETFAKAHPNLLQQVYESLKG